MIRSVALSSFSREYTERIRTKGNIHSPMRNRHRKGSVTFAGVSLLGGENMVEIIKLARSSNHNHPANLTGRCKSFPRLSNVIMTSNDPERSDRRITLIEVRLNSPTS